MTLASPAISPRAGETQERRTRARQSGLCVTCKKLPTAGRSVCDPCNEQAKMRVARMRERQREARKQSELARGYEAAGDTSMQRFAYIEASTQYERALTEVVSAEDEVRLCEKIGRSLFYGARPDFATAWYRRALERCRLTEALHAKIPALMRLLPAQLWLELRTREALESSLEARTLAVDAGDEEGVRYSNTSVGNLLVQLGHFDEARSYAPVSQQKAESATIRANRLNWLAMSFAAQGQALAAFAEFERAIDAAKELPDGYFATAIWDDYANWAVALGRLDIGRGCRERALLVARERRIAWRIPYLTLRFASMLVVAGDYQHARDLVRDALTYDTNTPVIRVLLATVGIETALALRDDALLERTLDNEVIELALRSDEGERVAPLAAAYVKLYAVRGQLQRAKGLIARAMPMVRQTDHAWDLLALVARYGSPADAERARNTLEKRMLVPHHRVAQAYLALWEAYATPRRSSENMKHDRAQRAARLFARLGRKHQQHEALALITPGRHGEKNKQLPSAIIREKQTPGIVAAGLTAREQQVADLALRGFTNRAIAEALAISEHTVETHMTSVLNRLGLRSRWQLIDRGA